MLDMNNGSEGITTKIFDIETFKIEDLVLKCIQNMVNKHKLSSPWGGPFIVSKVTGPGKYWLQKEDGTNIPNPWNI